MDKKVIILRGVSSSGKSTIAKFFSGKTVICTADDYFYGQNGNYNFNPNSLSIAHEQCFRKFFKALHDSDVETIVIANTNAKESDFKEYLEESQKRGIMVFSLVVEKRHENTNQHQVPEHALKRQEQNIKNSLKLI